MKFKNSLMGCFVLAAVASMAIAQTQNGPPLNRYGAVDVNATVPTDIQVPPAPAGFVPPAVNPLTQTWSGQIPTAPSFNNVSSYLLMSAQSGDVIAAFNPNLRVAPASLTKLMLMYIALQALQNGTIHLTDNVRVPTVAWATGGSRMFLSPGSEVSVQNLISGIIVDSGNDAAVTLANYIAGSQENMVNMMNQASVQLGMTNTDFQDVMGLPAPSHYSSARDLAVLTRAIVTQFPNAMPWFGVKFFTYDNIRQANFNKLLFIDPNADGMKTGSTNAAGFSLIGTAKLPNTPGHLIVVMMGADTNMHAAEYGRALLNYGFRYFKTLSVYTQNQVIQTVRIYKGKDKTLPIGTQTPVYVTLPNESGLTVNASLTLPKTLMAPIALGQTVGSVTLSANGKVIKTVPIVALKADPKGNWFRRASDTVALWF